LESTKTIRTCSGSPENSVLPNGDQQVLENDLVQRITGEGRIKHEKPLSLILSLFRKAATDGN